MTMVGAYGLGDDCAQGRNRRIGWSGMGGDLFRGIGGGRNSSDNQKLQAL